MSLSIEPGVEAAAAHRESVSVATARTVSLQGAVGHLVEVQVDVSPGVPTTILVGRVDASIAEGRDRCRTAVTNSGFAWPATKRVTVLLSPADLPKRGSHVDLAIALGVLVASDRRLDASVLNGMVLIGELSLDGALRTVPGVLPMVMAARAHGLTHAIVPEPQAAEAALVPGMRVTGVRSLAQAVAVVAGHDEVPEAPPIPGPASASLLEWDGRGGADDVDLRDLVGMSDARFGLEVAAAGGHHLLLSGPKGSGKTSLAERLPGILPDLDVEEALEVTALLSLSGLVTRGLVRRPPYLAPHHSASRASLLGGGSGRVRPGEVSRTHLGVLFLDEFPLFNADIVEALREPLESGRVTIARGDETATFPARSMVVLAANPCPCGDFHPMRRDHRCSCSEVRRQAYRRKLSGPVADRIDITRHIDPVQPWEVADPLAQPESTSAVRARVAAARARQRERLAGSPWRVNAEVPHSALRDRWPLSGDGRRLLDERLLGGDLTHRGATRVHRVAWTVADLVGAEAPGAEQVDLALRLRLGVPLPASAIGPR